jgi:methionyl-tRNA synthetase
MPEAAKNIYGQIGLADDVATIDPSKLEWGELEAGTKIGETVGVFPRIDKTKVMNEIKQPLAVSGQPSAPEHTIGASESLAPVVAGGASYAAAEGDSYITIDDFLKVELRVGEIKVAERIPNADKLLRFEIDLGEEQPRQILAGLAEYYEPEKLIESQGMICAASLTEGDTPALASFLEDVKVGARLK